MIIEGNKASPSKPCGASKNLAAHLKRTDTNEHVAVKEIRGLAADNIDDALRQIDAIAACTRATKPAYHAKINIEAGARLTPEQWQKTVDRLEQILGFEGQPRVVVEHIKNDHQHLHVVWSRIDLAKGRAIDTPNNFKKHEEVARSCEKEFGLESVKGAFHGRDPNEKGPERNAPDWAYHRAGRLGTKTPREMKAEVTALREECRNGHDYQVALDKAGYVLARGDRSGYCVVSPDGGIHNLAKYSGLRAAELRTFMSDIDREKLPSVKEAQARAEQVREREPERTKSGATSSYVKTADRLEKLTKEMSRETDRGLRVVGNVTGAAGKMLDKVADVAEAILSLFDPPVPKRNASHKIAWDPAPRQDLSEQRRAERERNAALKRIAEEIRKTKTITAIDLLALNRDDLDRLRMRGDDYLLAMVRQHEEEQARGRQRFRER